MESFGGGLDLARRRRVDLGDHEEPMFFSMIWRMRASTCGPPSMLCSVPPAGGVAPATVRPERSEVATVTLTERPTRSGFLSSSLGSSAMRTGTRWTILIQLPDAFCGGSSEKALPEPAPRPSTWPWKVTLLP